jgi:glycosyltransferase involved in cell wall biosynthesis
MNASVSIIIPTYNRCSFLGETLDSIIGQHYQNWECLIVDDGSTDYTEELTFFYCKGDDRIKFFKRPKHLKKGANSCRNYGFELSKGDYINWFDDDDVMLNNFISNKLETLEPGVQIHICSCFVVDEKLRNRKLIKLEKTYGLFKSYSLYELKIATNSVMFRREFLENKDLFLPGLEYGDETELFLRLFFQEPEQKHFLLNKPLFLYREHLDRKTEKNRASLSSFKYSVIFVAIGNFKRGILLRDRHIILFYYRKLISFFFEAINIGQKRNAHYLFKEMVPVLWNVNRTLGIEFYFWGNLVLLFNKGSYKIKKRLQKAAVNRL